MRCHGPPGPTLGSPPRATTCIPFRSGICSAGLASSATASATRGGGRARARFRQRLPCRGERPAAQDGGPGGEEVVDRERQWHPALLERLHRSERFRERAKRVPRRSPSPGRRSQIARAGAGGDPRTYAGRIRRIHGSDRSRTKRAFQPLGPGDGAPGRRVRTGSSLRTARRSIPALPPSPGRAAVCRPAPTRLAPLRPRRGSAAPPAGPAGPGG